MQRMQRYGSHRDGQQRPSVQLSCWRNRSVQSSWCRGGSNRRRGQAALSEQLTRTSQNWEAAHPRIGLARKKEGSQPRRAPTGDGEVACSSERPSTWTDDLERISTRAIAELARLHLEGTRQVIAHKFKEPLVESNSAWGSAFF